MEFIKHIKLVTAINPNNPVYNHGKSVPYLVISENAAKSGVIEISIDSPEYTGYVRQVTNQFDKDNFMSVVKKLSPYGFIGTSGDADSNNYFVVIDEMSQLFIDTVDSVETVPVRLNSDLGRAMRSIATTSRYIGYKHLDDLMSLFSFESNHFELYTLYNAIRRQRLGWRNNEFYLFSHKDTSNPDETMLVCYRVTFTEPDAAKSLLAGIVPQKPAEKESQTTMVGQVR